MARGHFRCNWFKTDLCFKIVDLKGLTGNFVFETIDLRDSEALLLQKTID